MIKRRMRSHRRVARSAIGLTLLLCSTGPGAAAGAPKPATHMVTIESTKFQPDVLSVKPGDIVVWVNKDMFPHTATSEGGGFDSGAIAAGKSWRYTFKKGGEFHYVCTFHPTMKATLRVK